MKKNIIMIFTLALFLFSCNLTTTKPTKTKDELLNNINKFMVASNETKKKLAEISDQIDTIVSLADVEKNENDDTNKLDKEKHIDELKKIGVQLERQLTNLKDELADLNIFAEKNKTTMNKEDAKEIKNVVDSLTKENNEAKELVEKSRTTVNSIQEKLNEMKAASEGNFFKKAWNFIKSAFEGIAAMLTAITAAVVAAAAFFDTVVLPVIVTIGTYLVEIGAIVLVIAV